MKKIFCTLCIIAGMLTNNFSKANPRFAGESFQQQFDRMLDYIKYTLEYTASHNVDPSDNQAVNNAISTTTQDFNNSNPGLDFGTANVVNLKDYASGSMNGYPAASHKYITRLSSEVYSNASISDLKQSIEQIKADIAKDGSLDELVREKLTVVCTTIQKFVDMFQDLTERYPDYFAPIAGQNAMLNFGGSLTDNAYTLQGSLLNLEENQTAYQLYQFQYRNWWSSWGKCLAGILGGMGLGGLEGASVGSSVPGLGTAAGAVIGGVCGGLAGAAAAC